MYMYMYTYKGLREGRTQRRPDVRLPPDALPLATFYPPLK